MLNQVCAHRKVAISAWTQSLTHSQVLDPVGWARPHYCLKYLSKHPHTTLHFNLYWKTVICIPCGTLQEGARLPSCVQNQGSSLVRAQRTLQDAKRTLARWLQLLRNFLRKQRSHTPFTYNCLNPTSWGCPSQSSSPSAHSFLRRAASLVAEAYAASLR